MLVLAPPPFTSRRNTTSSSSSLPSTRFKSIGPNLLPPTNLVLSGLTSPVPGSGFTAGSASRRRRFSSSRSRFLFSKSYCLFRASRSFRKSLDGLPATSETSGLISCSGPLEEQGIGVLESGKTGLISGLNDISRRSRNTSYTKRPLGRWYGRDLSERGSVRSRHIHMVGSGT
jgi:hypothetical protein